MTALIVSAVLFSTGVLFAGTGILLDITFDVYRKWKYDRF